MIGTLLLVSALYGAGWQGMALPNATLTPGEVAPGMTREKVCQTSWEDDDDLELWAGTRMGRWVSRGRGLVYLASQQDQSGRWDSSQRVPSPKVATRPIGNIRGWSGGSEQPPRTTPTAMPLLEYRWSGSGGPDDDAVSVHVAEAPRSDSNRVGQMALGARAGLAFERTAALQTWSPIRRGEYLSGQRDAATISAAGMSRLWSRSSTEIQTPASWGKDVRHVTQAMKIRVCQRYGARACPGPAWELDHLVSRELGGADTETNLWPQPITEARKKGCARERAPQGRLRGHDDPRRRPAPDPRGLDEGVPEDAGEMTITFWGAFLVWPVLPVLVALWARGVRGPRLREVWRRAPRSTACR